jgi:hypothetical protein
MKKNYTFVKKIGTIRFTTPEGEAIDIPLFPGILKHPSVSELAVVLRSPTAVRKYTYEALMKAPWPVLKEFPAVWLRICMEHAPLRPGRRRAIEFLLS